MKFLLLAFLVFHVSASACPREKFKHWIDADHNCLNTRDEVLKRDSLVPVVIVKCKVVSGAWLDPYSGKVYTDPKKLDIDHVVPICDAWRNGAEGWTPKKRMDFANDLSNLYAVSFSLNRSKGDSNVVVWLPPLESFKCDYVLRWNLIKARYTIGKLPEEQALITNKISECKKK